MLFAIDEGDNTIEEAAEIVIPYLKDDDQRFFIFREVKGS